MGAYRHGSTHAQTTSTRLNPFVTQPLSPHTRTIGGAFEFTFILPKPVNSGHRRPKLRKTFEENRKTPAPRTKRKATTKRKAATKPTPS